MHLLSQKAEGSRDDGPELAQAVRTFYTNLASLAVIRDPTGREGKLNAPTSPAMALLEYTASKRAQNCCMTPGTASMRTRVWCASGSAGELPRNQTTRIPRLPTCISKSAQKQSRPGASFSSWRGTRPKTDTRPVAVLGARLDARRRHGRVAVLRREQAMGRRQGDPQKSQDRRPHGPGERRAAGRQHHKGRGALWDAEQSVSRLARHHGAAGTGSA